jgi:hypothetical protein
MLNRGEGIELVDITPTSFYMQWHGTGQGGSVEDGELQRRSDLASDGEWGGSNDGVAERGEKEGHSHITP